MRTSTWTKKAMTYVGVVLLAGGLLAPPAHAATADDESVGCVEFMVICLEYAMAEESYWDMLITTSACDWLFKECVRKKLIGF